MGWRLSATLLRSRSSGRCGCLVSINPHSSSSSSLMVCVALIGPNQSEKSHSLLAGKIDGAVVQLEQSSVV